MDSGIQRCLVVPCISLKEKISIRDLLFLLYSWLMVVWILASKGNLDPLLYHRTYPDWHQGPRWRVFVHTMDFTNCSGPKGLKSMTVPLDWILVVIVVVAPMCIAHELIMSCIQRYLPRRTVCIGRTSLDVANYRSRAYRNRTEGESCYLAIVLFAHGYVPYIRCTVLIRSVSLPC